MIRAIFKYKSGFLVTALLGVGAYPLSSQELNKEVYVVRPYEPTLSDANKYNFLPETDDFETTTPKFRYSITPIRIANPFDPDPIKAAKTVTTSLPRIYNTWIKLGMGNYSTPMAEFNISNLRSKEYAYGAYLYHKSSHGNVRLDNDDKVKAGYMVNRMNFYLKKFLKGSTISGNLRFNQDGFNYYGYNTQRVSGPLDLDRDSLKQRIFNPGFDAGIQSNMTDNEQLNYNVAASYDYFFDKQKNKESSLFIRSTLSKSFNELLGGLDLSVDYSNLKGIDTLSNTIVRINPWISKRSTDWNFKLGFEAVIDAANITNFYFYPRANLDIIIIEEVLVPFIGLTGELQKNSYRNLYEENQFVKPGLSLKNTSSNIIVYGGLKGNVNSVLRFRADVSYTVYKNYHFFVNDTFTVAPLLPLQNQFTGVYDDINLITYHGQLALQPSEKLEMILDARYLDYKTFEESKPWHKPNLVIALDASYRPGKKMEIGAGISLVGKRWVRDFSQPEKMKKLDPVMDANFSLNYHYSKLLTVFAEFYNMTERSYEIWNQYPSQRFNFLMGFSYKL